ncbi:MAG: TonB family protein [Cycloclasticus sp.]
MNSKEQGLQNHNLRWGSSFIFVTAVYAGLSLLALAWPTSIEPPTSAPMAAMMVELAPLPAAPEATPQVAPPSPVQEEKSADPEPLPEPDIEPLAEIPIIEKAAALLAPKPEPIEETPTPIEEIVEQEELAPPSIVAPLDDIAAAPAEGAVSLTPSQAPALWQSALLHHLEKHKRYPRQARRRRHEAVVYVRVTINRAGKVIASQLSKACPYRTLNRETLALITRAQPLPPPPSEVSGETIEFVVPVAFSLKS